MNIKITKEQHEKLCKLDYEEYLFGSQLHGIANKESDFDYVRVISDEFYLSFISFARFLPNIHSWQYDGENSTQYVWMTETQFFRNLFSGDGNMIADVVLLSGKFDESLFLCRTYKIIKGFIGVAKRDLKLHGNDRKKKFHAIRSMMMAEKLMQNILPTVEDIQFYKQHYDNNPEPSKGQLEHKEQELRYKLNEMLNKGEVSTYPRFKEDNPLVQIMCDTNNITEFKY